MPVLGSSTPLGKRVVTLWIGTASGGLVRYDAERDRFQTFRAGAATGLAGDYVRTLQAAPGGELWVGCFGVTLQRFDPRRGVARDLPPGRLPALQRVHRVLDLPDGAGFAFVVDNGLLRWDGQSDQVQSLFEGAPGEVQPSIEWAVLDRDRQIWMGRLDGGLLRLGLDGVVRAHYHAGPDGALRSGEARGLLQTRRGEIWVGTLNGVVEIDGDRVLRYAGEESVAGTMPSVRVQDIMLDAEGGTWFGLDGAGLAHLPPHWRDFASFRHVPGEAASLSSPRVSAIALDDDNAAWVATANGSLDRIDPVTGTIERRVRGAVDADGG